MDNCESENGKCIRKKIRNERDIIRFSVQKEIEDSMKDFFFGNWQNKINEMVKNFLKRDESEAVIKKETKNCDI